MSDEGKKVADPGADCKERAAGCRQDRQILRFPEPRERRRTHPITGVGYIEVPPRRREVVYLRHAVPNLRAFKLSNGHLSFEMVSNEYLTEADARDAQNRAGWNEHGYGFYSFESEFVDDVWVTTWKCGGDCE